MLRIPNSFQVDLKNAQAVYSLRSEGNISVMN
ncbi:MAG: lipocalin family protein [Leptospira sp.]|nr:lipocalin family protein [Leptospira sp.]NCS93742.1 lipocalin family protein [Leptospira sp.]